MILTLHTDGGSLNNPGQAAIGFLIHDGDRCLYKHSEAIGIASNNVAEYTALIQALSYVSQQYSSAEIESIQVVADSQLMIKQMNGEYKVKHADIRVLYEKACLLARQIGRPINYTHVLREKNAEADALVKTALGR